MTNSDDDPELAGQLRQVPLFQGLDAAVLARVRGLARTKAIGAGDHFFDEGEAADAFFVLTSGRVSKPDLRYACVSASA